MVATLKKQPAFAAHNSRVEMGEENLGALSKVLKKKTRANKLFNEEVLQQQKLVRRRKVSKKQNLTANNPIFDLGMAIKNRMHDEDKTAVI